MDALVAGLGLGPGMSVLDVGCGDGVLQTYLRREIGATGRLMALDVSSAMLATFDRRFLATFPLLADAAAIPLPDAWYGYGHLLFGLSAHYGQDGRRAALASGIPVWPIYYASLMRMGLVVAFALKAIGWLLIFRSLSRPQPRPCN